MMISALLIISRAMVPPPLLLAVVPSRQAAFQRSAAPGVSGRRAGQLLVAQNDAPARAGSTQMATGQLATSALENAATWPNWAAVAHVQPGLFVLLLGWLAVKGQLERQAAADVAPVPQAVSRTADIAVKLGFPAWGKPLSEEETLLMVIERDLTWSLSITFIFFGSIGFGMGWATGPAMSGVLDIVDPQVVPVISAIGLWMVSYGASCTVSRRLPKPHSGTDELYIVTLVLLCPLLTTFYTCYATRSAVVGEILLRSLHPDCSSASHGGPILSTGLSGT